MQQRLTLPATPIVSKRKLNTSTFAWAKAYKKKRSRSSCPSHEGSVTQFSNASVEWLRQRAHSRFNTSKSPLMSGKRPAEFLRRPQTPHHRLREYGRVNHSALTYESVSPQAITRHRFPHSEGAIQSRPQQYRMQAMRISATIWFRIERKQGLDRDRMNYVLKGRKDISTCEVPHLLSVSSSRHASKKRSHSHHIPTHPSFLLPPSPQ